MANPAAVPPPELGGFTQLTALASAVLGVAQGVTGDVTTTVIQSDYFAEAFGMFPYIYRSAYAAGQAGFASFYKPNAIRGQKLLTAARGVIACRNYLNGFGTADHGSAFCDGATKFGTDIGSIINDAQATASSSAGAQECNGQNNWQQERIKKMQQADHAVAQWVSNDWNTKRPSQIEATALPTGRKAMVVPDLPDLAVDTPLAIGCR